MVRNSEEPPEMGLTSAGRTLARLLPCSSTELSRGSAMSLSVLMTLEEPLAGFIGMCWCSAFPEGWLEDTAKDEPGKIDEDNPFAASDEEQQPEAPAVRVSDIGIESSRMRVMISWSSFEPESAGNS
ncbi:hypothetical protein F5X96DRAFT_673084 [Biscogniauxia mediterranea]|nr:hypothetical protein F5X96DRAFT_673084 [Biscogniauxia mediterranea]